MEIIDSIADFGPTERSWALTIGNFDGVHLGHRKIIRTALDALKERNLAGLAVMTFEPHPMTVLHPEHAPAILTPMPLKKHLLAECGVDRLIILRDSFDLLNLSPEDFVDKFLMKTVEPSLLVEGPNFNFGYGRSGNVDTLRQLGETRRFEVIVAEPMRIQIGDDRTEMCSSSLIRDLLQQGQVAAASKVLGRFYRLVGQIIPGRGIGRQLGFPTANIDPGDQLVPTEGVYAGFVSAAQSADDVAANTARRPAAFSIGRAKTFLKDHPLLVEAHILEDDIEDLTGRWLAMDFVQRIRFQQRFADHDALSAQIAQDCDRAKDILAHADLDTP